MKKLAAFYFSGTGNTKYVAEKLCALLAPQYEVMLYDIADVEYSENKITKADTLMLAFPIYGSCPPIPMRRFLYANKSAFYGKETIIIVTQYMFSGDGAASLGRTAEKFGAKVKYAEHFIMPNNISDCNILKVRNGEDISDMLNKTDKRIEKFADVILKEKRRRRGFNIISHGIGFLSQRALFRKHEPNKRSLLKIDRTKCTGCGACVKRCPVGNLFMEDGAVKTKNECVLCYRCVNLCPQKSIALIGKSAPKSQYKGPYIGNRG